MKPLKLEDLVPQSASFTLSKTGKTYRLNPMSLSVEIWMRKTFGDRLETILTHGHLEDVCRIVFKLMDEEDKRDFIAQDVKFINDEGEEATVRMGGAELLFCLVQGYKEKIEIFKALLHTIGISQPMLDEFEKEEIKKKEALIQGNQPTGLQSSTSSVQSTDGPPNTSSAEPVAKSIGG